jgi:hypothetical protein
VSLDAQAAALCDMNVTSITTIASAGKVSGPRVLSVQ